MAFALFDYLEPNQRGSLRSNPIKRRMNMLGTVLLVLLILMVLGSVPTWPHSRNWGYYPSGGFGLLLLVLLILVLAGRVPLSL